MGFVKIFWKNNVQDAYSPKISNSGQIVSEILAQLCCDDSIQIYPSKSGLSQVLKIRNQVKLLEKDLYGVNGAELG